MYKVMQWQDRISQHLELTGNRDRLMRGLMFTARLVGLLAPSHKPAADAVALAMTDGVRLQRQFRWLMFARSFGDELGKARRAKTPAETAAGVLATAQSAGLCGFLLLDQLVFVSRLGLLKLAAEDRLLLASLPFLGGFLFFCLLLLPFPPPPFPISPVPTPTCSPPGPPIPSSSTPQLCLQSSSTCTSHSLLLLEHSFILFLSCVILLSL